MCQLQAKLFGKQDQLQSLDSLPIASHRPTSRIVTIPIRKIMESLDRSEDFDASFNPLKEGSRSRWVSILTAIRSNIPTPSLSWCRLEILTTRRMVTTASRLPVA